MSSENAISSIRKNALHFCSASCYSEDDTKLDDLSRLNKEIFGKSKRESFLEIADKHIKMDIQKRERVKSTLEDYEIYDESD